MSVKRERKVCPNSKCGSRQFQIKRIPEINDEEFLICQICKAEWPRYSLSTNFFKAATPEEVVESLRKQHEERFKPRIHLPGRDFSKKRFF